MIRAYTTNDSHAEGLKTAAAVKNNQLDIKSSLDADELRGKLDELSVLIFDLTVATLSAEQVMRALDSFEPEKVPPVLYLLASPADIEAITQAGSIINQDYSFVPIEPQNLAARLEVLKMLGARRKLTLESAITDRMTGLFNRKYFIRRLEEELYRSARYQYNVTILLAGVDFAALQGTLTEQAGDAVMHEVGEFFRGRLRKSDIVARYKWDDFAILLPDIPVEDGLAVAKDVKAKLELLQVDADGLQIKLLVSVGVVSFPVDGVSTAIDVIGALEDCTLKAKSVGAGFVLYTPGLQAN
jgi:diguanylate cyclase (GGDEF)-like protein